MLVDYGEDFTGKNDVVKLVKTTYRVGKGMLPDDAQAVEPEAETQELPAKDIAAETVVADDQEETRSEEVDVSLKKTDETKHAAQPSVPRRRMRFGFADGTSPVITEMETI